MKISIKLLLVACTVSILTACGNNTPSTQVDAITDKSAIAVAVTQASLPLTVDAYRPPEGSTSSESPMKARDPNTAPTATNIAMGAPQDSLTAAARKNNETSAENNMGKPLQIGFGRNVAQTANTAATNQVLKWQATAAGGHVAAINFSSTGAKGIRIGLLISQLPASATLRFYVKGDATAFEVKGAEVLAVIAKNVASGDTSSDARTYWSPVFKTNNGTVEIEIPAGMNTNDVQVSIPIISHLFMSMSEAQTISAQATYDSSDPFRTGNLGLACQVDVKCTTPLPAASDAVAWLVFNKSGGFANICSGTLLNDNLNSGTPYILTANHCISTQTFASTLFTDFKFRSLTCNNAATGEYFPTATTGAALLYTAYNTDSTLLRLNGAPSTPVLFAGWDATTAPTTSTTGIHSIHHPRGDQQRLSRGSITGYSTRNATVPTSFIDSNITNGTILDVTLTTGLTEGGSSGSALFKGTDANPQVIGQLFGGTAPTCGVNPNNVYGRFDVAYNAGMSDWLTQGVKTVTQLYNVSTGVHYYTIGVTDVNNVINANAGYINQGSAFKASTVPAAGLSPVYRFFDTTNGTTFYTISEKERAAVATNTLRMRYDGIVWYANATPAAGTVPLYSAFNKTTGSQYFTTSLAARSNLIATNPQFITDGIAFHVTP
jgi:lysyl endopeptidase